MLERLHEHIVSELGQSSRTDTIFVIVAILFDLIVLGINSAAAATAVAPGSGSEAADIVLVVFILMTLVINAIAIAGLCGTPDSKQIAGRACLHVCRQPG